MIIYNIKTNGLSNELVIEVMNDSVYVEPSAVAYVVGNLVLDASIHKAGARIKSHFIGKKYYRPCFVGTGTIYLKATLGSYHKFTLKDDQHLIINNNAFIACRNSIILDPQVDISVSKFLSGTPLVTNHVTGNGNLMLLMPGEVVETKLENDKFVAYNNDIAAYSASLKLTRELACKKGALSIAHRLVYVYRGTGSVFFAPHPNKGTKTK